MRWIERQWNRRGPGSYALWPLSVLYCLLATLRRAWYRRSGRKPAPLGVPVIVVGNITVGGTGKTPLVIWLARWLSSRGITPGIVTRGYGGRSPTWPLVVTATTDPELCGDEPLLLARHAGCAVVADPSRARGAACLAAEHHVGAIVSDDGLQHYAMGRDIEIAVIDGMRRFGNGFCLPAGPLREPLGRLRDVDAIVAQGDAQAGEFAMQLVEGRLRHLISGKTSDVSAFQGRTVHAVAGIGNPGRFFDRLRRFGLDLVEHPFPDHHRFQPADLQYGDDRPVIMTEKDAVKCERFAVGDCWFLEVSACPDPRFTDELARLLKEAKRG
jgi:tetraacyldisaccharide 4'-kinase